MIGLMKHSDSVELKLTVADSAIRSTADALGMDPLQAEIRQVVFFDTPALILSKAGVVVRARRIQGGEGDTVIKLRPVKPETLSPDVRKSASVKIEVDTMPKGFVCSVSMKGKTTADDVRDVILKRTKIRDLFTKEQRAFYKAHAPDGLKLKQLSPLGPINLMKLQFEPDGLKRRFVAELWMYPDGSRILELSTKASVEDAFQVAARTLAFLKKKGLDLTAEQQPKTNRALKHFSNLLKKVRARS
ncbi:MAG: adenylate cyclase [Acidobacteriota bacterium]